MGRPSTRPKSEVSLAITRMRENQGDTMEAFAARLKVALNTVSRWENLRPPRGKSLQKLYNFAKRHGPAASADTLSNAIAQETSGRVSAHPGRKRYLAAQKTCNGCECFCGSYGSSRKRSRTKTRFTTRCGAHTC